MKIVVSACLLGENCKYNGGNNYCQKVVDLVKGREVIRVCPEVLAGMPVPRVPIEIKDGIVVDRDGNVVDAVIREAVAKTLLQLKDEDIEYAVLKARSPTCGVHRIYDGTFTGGKVAGNGVTVDLFLKNGIPVFTEAELDQLPL